MSVFFAEAPPAAVIGSLQIVLALTILGLLMYVIYMRVQSATILHITLIIDIIFCVSMMLSAMYTMGAEGQLRKQQIASATQDAEE